MPGREREFRGQERWSIQPFVASFVSSLLEFTGGIGTVLNDEDLAWEEIARATESRVLTKEVYIYGIWRRIFAIRGGETKFADDFVTEYSFGNINIRQLILIKLCYM